ncbi:MAG: MotA/TolQ/ExbB proton channel family protein [Planctomycetota bacterium]|nr:MAG: MotA/TolQ/ExbB proton channel family protein [Planctomycetota bacterium]
MFRSRRQEARVIRKTMRHRRLLWIVCGALAAALAQPAAAQEIGDATRETVSAWSTIWKGLDWPAYIIVAGSLLTIALIIEHFLAVRAETIAPAAQVKRCRQLIERRKFRECQDVVRKSSTFFARCMAAALRHARHGHAAMHAAATEKSAELSGQMFRKVEYLNILGNLGPLMGLLGTVYGMIIAFSDLGAGGGEASADAGELARGIALALVNTLLGLMLAIIGLGFFGWCRNRVDALTIRATVQVLDLLEYFRPAQAESAAAPPPRVAPPARSAASTPGS